jgi:hypothetical protein
MPAGWPALGPIFKDDPNPDLIGGHPTSAGALDRDDRYPKLPADDTNRGNGPQQPGVDYDDGTPT